VSPYVRHHSDLGDKDPMPIGKFKGTPMQDVPARYLLWMADDMGRDVQGDRWRVRRYIDHNRDALELEAAEKDTDAKQARATRSEQRGVREFSSSGDGDPDATE
jgi:hypothetical protein